MRFESWYFLIALSVIPLLYRWWAGRNRPARVVFPFAVPKLVSGRSPVGIMLAMKCLGLALLVLALARPQSSYRETERTVSGVDIMMLMDVSASMNIEDMSGGSRSRFDIAKDVMENFVKARRNDRIGFTMFSGEAITLAPVTLDSGLVLKAIRDARSGILKDGTAIGDGLALAVSNLKSSKAKSKIIVLLTDGDNNLGQIDPATAGDLAAGFGIKTYTIAIGTEGRVRMPIKVETPFGNTVTTYQTFENALNPELLVQIAGVTGGKFYRVQDEGTLAAVFKEIDSLETSEVKSTEKVRYDEIYQEPLRYGILTLAIQQILERGWWRLLP